MVGEIATVGSLLAPRSMMSSGARPPSRDENAMPSRCGFVTERLNVPSPVIRLETSYSTHEFTGAVATSTIRSVMWLGRVSQVTVFSSHSLATP